MDNDRIEGFGDLGNPTFLLLGVASLVVVLMFLHGGGWRLLTHFVLEIASTCYGFAMGLALFATPVLYLAAICGPPEARAVRLIWALILTAWFVLSSKVFYGDNRLTRFAEHFRIR
jgi:hypothetical protein